MKNIENEDRAFRGGSWDLITAVCRESDRDEYEPGEPYYDLGFRVLHRRRRKK